MLVFASKRFLGTFAAGLGSNPVLVELVLVELDFRYSSAVQLVLRISSSNPVELEKMRYSSSTELE